MNNRNKSNNNSYWIVGKHAVESALKNSRRVKYKLCITKENLASLEIDNLELKPAIMSRSEISIIAENANTHQGVGQLKILRDTTNIFEHAIQSNYGNFITSTDTISYLDSPSTSSQITFKLQFKKIGSGQTIKFNSIYGQSDGIGASTLTLMEILA